MPQTAIPTAAGETAGSGRAPHYLLAYLEEGRVRVYASGKPAYGSDGSFPERTKCSIEAELQRLHRTGQRTGIVEICLSAGGNSAAYACSA